jgi:hypothetical protein
VLTDRNGEYELTGVPLGIGCISVATPFGFVPEAPREFDVTDLRACVAADFTLHATGDRGLLDLSDKLGNKTGGQQENCQSVPSCNSFRINELELEAPPGFEPGMEVLQTSALPLGDGAGRNWGSKLTWDFRPRLWTRPTATSGKIEGVQLRRVQQGR